MTDLEATELLVLAAAAASTAATALAEADRHLATIDPHHGPGPQTLAADARDLARQAKELQHRIEHRQTQLRLRIRRDGGS